MKVRILIGYKKFSKDTADFKYVLSDKYKIIFLAPSIRLTGFRYFNFSIDSTPNNITYYILRRYKIIVVGSYDINVVRLLLSLSHVVVGSYYCRTEYSGLFIGCGYLTYMSPIKKYLEYMMEKYEYFSIRDLFIN